jgi:hypothetical protein
MLIKAKDLVSGKEEYFSLPSLTLGNILNGIVK